MKKSEQNAINEKVMIAIEKINAELEKAPYFDIKARRLRSCNASVFETENFYILKSYRTIVAAIDKNSDTLYDFLRFVYGYTSTSAQHISKFEKDYCCGKWNCNDRYTYYYV